MDTLEIYSRVSSGKRKKTQASKPAKLKDPEPNRVKTSICKTLPPGWVWKV